MHLRTLTASYERSSSPFADHDPRFDPSRWLPEARWSSVAIHKATAIPQVREACQGEVDVIVNLCDGCWDEDRAGIEVVQTLERLGVAFTGSDSRFYEPSREIMKRVCHYLGVDSPRYAFVREVGEAAALAEHLRFPMIVKHPSSYGSRALFRNGRVTTVDALVERVEVMVAEFGEALIEEFITGREFTVLVADPAPGDSEPRAWVPFEVLFPPGEEFKHFDLKWVGHASMGWAPVTDDALAERLIAATRAVFVGLDGSGYGRCDLRMGDDGRVHVLEINSNPGVFYPPGHEGSADMILGLHDDGHRDFLAHIVAAGQARRDRLRPRWKVRYRPATDDYELVAAMDIAAGERITVGETRAHHLVTTAHVQRAFSTQERDWFDRYAWPLTDGLYAMWSDRPEDWAPINHSCDPNVLLDGLDQIARRDIRAGEPLTLDYATFCGPPMPAFECDCGAAECRGVIRPDDHLADWLSERYGDNISDYVRRARRQRQRQDD